MALTSVQKRIRMGSLLVALQFGFIFVLAALALPKLLQLAISLGALVLVAAAVALAVWILRHNRLGNFSIHPNPLASGVLVTSGPYRWMRHPMYTAVLLGAAALALLSNPLMGWPAWAALALVLLLKSRLEERWMRERHAGYDAYCARSKRFVPWLF